MLCFFLASPTTPHLTFIFYMSLKTLATNFPQGKVRIEFLCFADMFREILNIIACPNCGFVLEIAITPPLHTKYTHTSEAQVMLSCGEKLRSSKINDGLRRKKKVFQSFGIVFFFHLKHSSTNYIATIFLHTGNDFFTHLLSCTDKSNGKAVVIMLHSDVLGSTFH